MNRRLVCQAWAEDQIHLGSRVIASVYVPSQTFTFGALNFIASAAARLALTTILSEGEVLTFGSLEFITVHFSGTCLQNPAPRRVEERASRQPLGSPTTIH